MTASTDAYASPDGGILDTSQGAHALTRQARKRPVLTLKRCANLQGGCVYGALKRGRVSPLGPRRPLPARRKRVRAAACAVTERLSFWVDGKRTRRGPTASQGQRPDRAGAGGVCSSGSASAEGAAAGDETSLRPGCAQAGRTASRRDGM